MLSSFIFKVSIISNPTHPLTANTMAGLVNSKPITEKTQLTNQQTQSSSNKIVPTDNASTTAFGE